MAASKQQHSIEHGWQADPLPHTQSVDVPHRILERVFNEVAILATATPHKLYSFPLVESGPYQWGQQLQVLLIAV